MKKTVIMLIVAIIIATGIEIYVYTNGRFLVDSESVTFLFIVVTIVQMVCGFILFDIYKNRKK